MKTASTLVVLIIAAFIVLPSFLHANDWNNRIWKGSIIIYLVKGTFDQIATPAYGYSATIDIYFEPEPKYASPSDPIDFEVVASNITAERRSSKTISDSDFYGEFGHLPSGIYWMYYHRFDFKRQRSRYGLSDFRCKGYVGNCNNTISYHFKGSKITRRNIQMHRSFKDMKPDEFSDDFSEGCIVFNKDSDERLFPFPLNYNNSPSSPLADHDSNNIEYKGYGYVLVFVTDWTYKDDPDRNQQRQLEYFEELINGKLTICTLSNPTKMDEVRKEWNRIPIEKTLNNFLPPPPPPPLKPSSIRVE